MTVATPLPHNSGEGAAADKRAMLIYDIYRIVHIMHVTLPESVQATMPYTGQRVLEAYERAELHVIATGA